MNLSSYKEEKDIANEIRELAKSIKTQTKQSSLIFYQGKTNFKGKKSASLTYNITLMQRVYDSTNLVTRN